jgi:hypothetical protein
MAHESRELADAAGIDEDQTHATVGFAQLAWLRGDHTHAADVMEEILPTLRRLGDQRCTGRALYLLGQHAHQHGQLARAEDLLRAGIEAVTLAGQSSSSPTPWNSWPPSTTNKATTAGPPCRSGWPMPRASPQPSTRRPVDPSDETLHHALTETLGVEEFNAAHTEGQQTPVATASRR